MASFVYPEPKAIVWHKSGALDADGLSEEWLAHEKILGFRPAVNLDGTPEQQREVLNAGSAIRDAHLKDMNTLKSEVEARDDEIAGTEGHKIPIRIYTPKGLSSPAPAAVFYHGGGWILGNIQADDIFCRMISRDLGHVVVSVEYRLAPEHSHPAGLDDCYDAFVWTVENASKLNIDSKKIYVTGNSAGGHLSAAVALKITESKHASSLAAQILRIPFACDPEHYPSELPERSTVPIFNDAALSAMLGVYAPNAADRKSHYVSPLVARPELVKKLPPTYIDVCSADPLCVPGIAYGKLLEDNGVPVRVFVLEGMPHGSYVLFPDLPSSRTAWDSCVEATKWALNGGK